MSVTIITTTYNRNKVLERCLACVDSQIYTNWKHLVIVDDISTESHISQELIKKYSSDKREFIALGERSNNYGNTPRQFGIMKSESDYILFLDDDNVIFPDYLQVMMEYMLQNPDVDMGICKIIHMGPLPARLCPPPKVLDGNPPVLQNIDTLQVCIKRHIAQTYGWLNMGYCADGHTFELWAKNCKYGFVDSILGVHM